MSVIKNSMPSRRRIRRHEYITPTAALECRVLLDSTYTTGTGISDIGTTTPPFGTTTASPPGGTTTGTNSGTGLGTFSVTDLTEHAAFKQYTTAHPNSTATEDMQWALTRGGLSEQLITEMFSLSSTLIPTEILTTLPSHAILSTIPAPTPLTAAPTNPARPLLKEQKLNKETIVTGVLWAKIQDTGSDYDWSIRFSKTKRQNWQRQWVSPQEYNAIRDMAENSAIEIQRLDRLIENLKMAIDNLTDVGNYFAVMGVLPLFGVVPIVSAAAAFDFSQSLNKILNCNNMNRTIELSHYSAWNVQLSTGSGMTWISDSTADDTTTKFSKYMETVPFSSLAAMYNNSPALLIEFAISEVYTYVSPGDMPEHVRNAFITSDPEGGEWQW